MSTQTSPLGPTAHLLIVALLASVSFTALAAAEVLVLQDGQMIETQGPWTVDGRRITYTAINGTFSSLRTSLVDVDKSLEVSEARLNPAPPDDPPRQARAAGLVVRQGDLRSATASTPSDAEATPEADAAGDISVVEWREVLSVDGTRLAGTLRNDTEGVYIALVLNVTLIAENGDQLSTRSAKLDRTWADPGTSVTFDAAFPDVYSYTDAVFKIDGKSFERRDPEQDDPEQDGDAEFATDAQSGAGSTTTARADTDPPR